MVPYLGSCAGVYCRGGFTGGCGAAAQESSSAGGLQCCNLWCCGGGHCRGHRGVGWSMVSLVNLNALSPRR